MFSEFNKFIELHDKAIINRLYTHEEVKGFEKQFGWKLPQEYSDFLTKVGAFEFTYDDFGSKFTFLGLEKIQDWSKEVFRSYENYLPRILLIAHSTSGEEFGFIKGRELLYVFNPECPCDLWLEEQMGKFEFSEWLRLLIDSEFESLW